MSIDAQFTKDNLNLYLKELAKEFRRLNGAATPAEITLIGGASILANYGFRETTYDMDAIIMASSAMKEAINRVGDKFNLPNGWLNEDAKRTKSYSSKLLEVSAYYKTFSNILTVRTVTAEYLIAMKLMSGRKYKHDISDVAGILWEHEKGGRPITIEAIEEAVNTLYGGWESIPDDSKDFIRAILVTNDYEILYLKSQESERHSKEVLLKFDADYPNVLNEDNIDSVLEKARRRQWDRDER